MKKICKLLSFLLICTLGATVLSGCGEKNNVATTTNEAYVMDKNLNPPGEFPVCKEKITLTVGIPKDALVTDYDENLYTKALEEKMNCDIEFVYLPSTVAEAKQKVELMIAADGKDLPDIIVNVPMEDSSILRYGSRGFIKSLNQYYDNSAYYLNDVLKAETNLKDMITMADGNIYVIPRYQKILQNELGYRMWIYKPWLEKLNLSEPKTLDEFYNVLKAFKEKDPNGNGLADEIPFIGATSGGENWFCDFIAAAFQPIDIQSNYLYPENGKIKAAYVEPEYKEALKYLNKLCTEGLLSPSSFTSDGAQTRQTIQNPSGVQVGCFTSMAPTYLINATDRAEGYDILAPLTQDNGTGYAVYGASIPTNSFFITKNCQYPEAAFRLGDIMMSEEMSIWNRFGKKGTDWVEPEEGDHGMFESMGYKAKIKPILAWGSPQNSYWQQGAPAYRGYELACATVDSGSNIYETRIAEHLQSYLDKKPKEYITKIIYTEDEINAINEIQQNITSYRKDSVARFIIGDWDIESGWEDYLKEMKAIGVDEMLDIVQKAYDRCNK